jgi:hypothetical protein
LVAINRLTDAVVANETPTRTTLTDALLINAAEQRKRVGR